MCGIGIARYKDLAGILENQEDRGLDSLGIVNLKHKQYYKCLRTKVKDYVKYIDSIEEKSGLCILHHRKASVGNVNMDNCHPFVGKKFLLMQNGTNKKFYNTYKDTYKKDTDSETLLDLIEETCDKLEDIPDGLKGLEGTFGIVIVVEVATLKTLIYADGARENRINIQNGLLKQYLNYEPDTFKGFKNIGSIIFDRDGKILHKEFEDKLNTVSFYTTYFTPKSSYRNSSRKNNYGTYGSYDDYRNWDYRYEEANKKTKKGDQTKLPTEDMVWESELHNIGLSFTAVNALSKEGIITYEAFLELDQLYINSMNTTETIKKEIENMLVDCGIKLEEPKAVYSEEILKDDTLLYNDMLCYQIRYPKSTIQDYGFDYMGIAYTDSIKKKVGKKDWRRMKKFFSKGTLLINK